MNREIKFRGVCAISNELVYGDLMHGVGTKSGNVYILPNKVNLAHVKHCDPLDGVKVDPKTVMQYTGLKDDFGREIYERDYVNTVYGTFAVEWNDDCCKWQYTNGMDLNDGDMYGMSKIIFGNSFENPEPLQP